MNAGTNDVGDIHMDAEAWLRAVPEAFRDDPAMRFQARSSDLPNVLIIGDSISMGYTPVVRARLSGLASVSRVPDNAASTERTLRSIDAWLGPEPWDVVHVNWGLHDLRRIDRRDGSPGGADILVPLDEYRSNLNLLFDRIEERTAALSVATTTPVPEGAAFRVAGDELAYNAALIAAARAWQAPVVDLWTLVRGFDDKQVMPANVHFTERGSEALGAAVADSIRASLSRRA